MATKQLTIRIEESLKDDFDVYCNNIGLTTTSAIMMFVRGTSPRLHVSLSQEATG